MSDFLGDFAASKVVRVRFNTISPTTGAPATLTPGSAPTVVIRKDGAVVTPSGGVTLVADADSVVGFNTLTIDMGVDTTTFTAGSEYMARLGAGALVGSISAAGIVVGEWSVANRNHAPNAGSIDFASLTPALASMLTRAYVVSTGVTVGPVTADIYAVAGFNANVPYYKSTSLGTPVYAWTDGTFWYMTTTLPGASLPAGYFKTGTPATVIGPYTLQGTATGTPTVAAHGNSILATFQPDGPLADTAGTTTLLGRITATPPTAAQTAAAVRDVDNTSPATGSLGAKVNTAATGSGGGGGGFVAVGTGTVVSAVNSPSTTQIDMTSTNFDTTPGAYNGRFFVFDTSTTAPFLVTGPCVHTYASNVHTFRFAVPNSRAPDIGDVAKLMGLETTSQS